MAYCRFSTNDFGCDLYCYEDVMGGYTTHVAAVKVVFDQPLPDPVPLNHENPGVWLQRHEQVMQMAKRCGRVPIGLPYDGQTFNDATLDDFLSRLQLLRDAGYRFPDYVFDLAREWS